MKKNKLYILTMYKYGERDGASYIAYAGFSKHKALSTEETVNKLSGDKYKGEIVELTPDEILTMKTIKSVTVCGIMAEKK